jgi:hypothetical protein
MFGRAGLFFVAGQLDLTSRGAGGLFRVRK